ncbi:AAA family ATPase [Candidatus Gracilibacteria bacterium]|nr:AAA family ATPase [Candidatus Gracilibacteria bacterium]
MAQGTLLFADVSGSTALAERLSERGREGSEIVTATLNSYFGTMIQIVQAAGGDILTFGGDALLVLFSSDAHAQNAAHAALALLHELHDFERSVSGVGTFRLSMHIGVESGRIALVSAGPPDALRYGVMGATVNRVALAEGCGGRGELVVGPNTWQHIAVFASAEERQPGYFKVDHLVGQQHGSPVQEQLPSLDHSVAAVAELITRLEHLTPYLPPDLLVRILADPQRPRVEADLRPVTVLFAQLRGLGTFIESLPAADAANVLDAVLSPIQAAVQRYGGFINKLDLADEGEKILAVFGAPTAYEDHAERAGRAALAMLDVIADCRLQIVDCTDLQLRVGLNTGLVFAGNVGTAERKEYTVMGDAVNVAARVMAKAEWGAIWCSAATADRINPRLHCEDRGQAQVRGRVEALQLYALVGEREAVLPPVEHLPLVGRDVELAWLEERLDAVRAGSGRVLRISGEAGIGKTRLVAELLARHAAELRLIEVSCLSYATNTPYAPWSEVLKALCGITSGEAQEQRALKLAAALSQLGAGSEEWMPLLAELVRLDVADNVLVRALDPQQRQSRRFELIADLLLAEAAREPLMLFLDNLQWADQISLDLWQYLAGRVDEAPIALLAAHRSGLNWGDDTQGDRAEELVVPELPASACAALLDQQPEAAQLSPEVREQIVARADGNPLYLEELTRALAAQESEIALDALPDSLNELLLARIDRLDERSRTLLRVAAVIGQRFPVDVLRHIQGTDYQALLQQLTRLDAEEVTQLERENPERVHLFATRCCKRSPIRACSSPAAVKFTVVSAIIWSGAMPPIGRRCARSTAIACSPAAWCRSGATAPCCAALTAR